MNFERELNFEKSANANYSSYMKKELKKNNRTKKEEYIYGEFYGDMENIFDDNEEIEQSNIQEKNYLNVKFVKGSKQSDLNYENRNKKKENLSESDHEMIKQEFVEDFTMQKDISNNKEDKKIEAKLSRKYGKGFDLLKKSGYKIGSGLGVNKQGITDPIMIKKRKKNIGISKNDKEKLECSDDEMISFTKQQDDYFLGKKKKEKEKKIEEIKNNIDEFECHLDKWKLYRNKIGDDEFTHLDFEELPSVPNLKFDLKTKQIIEDKVIDLIIKSKRIIGKRILNFIPDDPEEGIERLKELLLEIIKKSKNGVTSNLSKLKQNLDNQMYSKFETDNLKNEINLINNKKNRKDEFRRQLEILNCKIKEICKSEYEFDYLSYLDYFVELYDNNSQDYSEYRKLTNYCLNEIINRMKLEFKLEDYFKKKNKIFQILKAVKALIEKTCPNERELDNDDNLYPIHMFSRRKMNKPNPEIELSIDNSICVYAYFLNKIIIDELINYIINIWNIKDCDRLIDMLSFYTSNNVIPEVIKDYLYDEALIPRIKEYLINEWNFQSEKNGLLVHLYIHPWLEILSLQKLSPIIKIIQKKLESQILNLDVSNLEYVEFFKIWKNIWDNEYLIEMMNKFIIPKLTYIVSKFEVNPRTQNLNALKILFAYFNQNLLPADKCIEILNKHFFPKWLEALHEWLTQDQINEKSFNEIQIWYQGWKKYFEKNNLLENEDVKSNFKSALLLIYKYSNV